MDWSLRSAGVVASLVCACASAHQHNRPLEGAVGTIERTGFARSSTTSQTGGIANVVSETTRTGQAASVVEGPRGDRLWRISSDGLFLEYCQLLDDRPYDCSLVPFPVPVWHPALVDPRNLGRGTTVTQSPDTLQVAGTATELSGTLPTTPRFGVWVLTNPTLGSAALGGQFGAPIAGVLFCYLDDQGRPKCVGSPATIMRALSVHVLARSDVEGDIAATNASGTAQQRFTHVLWGQPAGGGVAARCEADELVGTVKCQNATEKRQP